MNKELQDLAWSVLPKEFRKEMKKIYNADDPLVSHEENEIFDYLFGEHNLTSDEEGEEMLTVSRKKVQEEYAIISKELSHRDTDAEDYIAWNYAKMTFEELFGSKCLPDEAPLSQNPSENCDTENHISTDCDKPAEPKFKVGDKVKDISSPHDDGIYKVYDIKKSSDGFIYHIQGLIGQSNVKESDLEPYTEPTDFGREVNFPTKNNLAIYLKKSKNCDNRLQIAAMAMQGILSNIDLFKNVLETGTETLSGDGISYRAVAKASLLFADALIAESEKRTGHGK